jgi:hypothetical protein
MRPLVTACAPRSFNRFQFGNRRPSGVGNRHLVAERGSLVIIEQATKRGVMQFDKFFCDIELVKEKLRAMKAAD